MSSFDVVVIGSGAGGAPIACRLAEAGRKVLVVEKGKAYKREEYTRDEIEWVRRDKLVPSPLTDPHTRRSDEGQRAAPTTDGWISVVVGGGTVHMGAYFVRATPDDARQQTRLQGEKGHSALDWAVPYDDVARHYETLEREIGISGTVDGKYPPLVAHTLSQKVDEAAKRVGFASIPTPRAIITQARPDEDRLACAYRMLCASYGCPNDARGSMPATYLKRAHKTGNLTLWTETRAKRLVKDASGNVGSVVLLKSDGSEVEVKAGTVVVACSAIESARLLLLSGDGFNPGGQVGKNFWFSVHTEVTGFFDKQKHQDVSDLMAGSPFLNRTINLGGLLDSERKKAFDVDRSGMWEASFVHDNPIHRAERVATQSGNTLLFGKALKDQLVRNFRGGRGVILEGFGEAVPHPGAYVDLDPNLKDQAGLPVARITYFHHVRDQRVAKQMTKDGEEILRAMGADDVRTTVSLGETDVLQGGTCRFGNDEKNSVCTPAGNVHGIKNLYVTDGGALPSSTGGPMTLTILANSLRVAELLTKQG